MARLLTIDEIEILKPVFKNTLRYGAINCDVNKYDLGGEENSITPAGRAYFSRKIYCDDFSKKDADAQWVFVHEMTHVWQWQHGRYPVYEAAGLKIKYKGDYKKAYPYDLMPGKELSDYNMEQQAAIVADYWALTQQSQPWYNHNLNATLSDYTALIGQLLKSGPPDPWAKVPI